MNEVKLDKQSYENMKRRLSKLDALESGGVDNWEGYDFALEEWLKEEEVNDLVENFVYDLHDILVEADVEQPAGAGCGYAIHFDEQGVTAALNKLLERYKNIMREGK